MKSAGVCGVKCFYKMLPKYFSQLLFCGEFQIMRTEQHGLVFYTVFLLFNAFELLF